MFLAGAGIRQGLLQAERRACPQDLSSASHSRQQKFCGSDHNKVLALFCQHLLETDSGRREGREMESAQNRAASRQVCPQKAAVLTRTKEKDEWAELFVEKCS